MWSFVTGLGCAVVLAGVTLWVLEAGTITMVEESNDFSTLIEGVWSGGAQGFPDPEDTQ